MNWTAIGSPDELKFDPGVPVRIGKRWIAVFRQGTGDLVEYFAIDNACPHASAPLCDGTQMHGKIVCSLHLWEFDLRTGACDVAGDWSVATYPVRERDGQLEVGTPD
jgi:nitrite reductase/ring-hydroxylating ferredoxin subunit